MVRRNESQPRNNTGAQVEEHEERSSHANRLDPYVRGREGDRQIKQHPRKRRTANSVQEAVVKTKSGLPDMRFAENQMKFKKDLSKRVNGEEDLRFLENRPDIVQLHEERGESKPNVIFNDDGGIQEEFED